MNAAAVMARTKVSFALPAFVVSTVIMKQSASQRLETTFVYPEYEVPLYARTR